MKVFEEKIRAALAQSSGLDPKSIVLEAPKQRALGDFAFPCFVLAKQKGIAPNLLANELASTLRIPQISAQGSGPYLNFTVDRSALAKEILYAILKDPKNYGRSTQGKGKTIVIDYSSPNIAKPFGVGHLRSTVIGAAIKRILESQGYQCVGVNHLGDWGMQFGRMLAAVKLYDPQENFIKAAEPTKALLDLYVRIHNEEETNPAIKEQARSWFLKLESGQDAEAKRIWKLLVDLSWKEFDRIYRMLGISFEKVQGESFYEDKLEAAVARIEKTGVSEISQGALIVDLEAQKLPPCLLKTQDGTTLYATRDFAALFYRQETWQFHKALYVVGADQRLHFQQLKAVLAKMKLPWADSVVHVDFGMMRLPTGKMSTREGRVIFLDEVLSRAVEMAQEIIREKNPELKNAEETASAIGIGAIVFNDLKNNRVKDVTFDWKAVLNFDGETGPYVQYTHARLCSILRKYGKAVELEKIDFSKFEEAGTLLALLGRFSNAIERAGESYEPSILTNYLLELAQTSNAFYKDHRVLGEAEEITRARVAIVDAARSVLREGLSLLGVNAPEEM